MRCLLSHFSVHLNRLVNRLANRLVNRQALLQYCPNLSFNLATSKDTLTHLLEKQLILSLTLKILSCLIEDHGTRLENADFNLIYSKLT